MLPVGLFSAQGKHLFLIGLVSQRGFACGRDNALHSFFEVLPARASSSKRSSWRCHAASSPVSVTVTLASRSPLSERVRSVLRTSMEAEEGGNGVSIQVPGCTSGSANAFARYLLPRDWTMVCSATLSSKFTSEPSGRVVRAFTITTLCSPLNVRAGDKGSQFRRFGSAPVSPPRKEYPVAVEAV